MLKVKLKYTDCYNDKGIVYQVITNYDIKILKEKKSCSDSTITLLIEDHNKLNEMIKVLNRYIVYGVSVVKVKDLDKSIFHKIFK